MEKNGGGGISIFQILRDKGFSTVPEGFYDRISLWRSWYDGDVRGFHDYKVYNGQKTLPCKRYTLNMGKKVAEDWANLLLNEKVAVTLEGRAEQAFFDQVCKENSFLVKANECQELKAGLGTAAYVARVEGATAWAGAGQVTGGRIVLDYVDAGHIYPLSWRNSKAEECAFTSSVSQGDKKYLYLQIHRKGPGGVYRIENSLYEDRQGSLQEAALSSVKEFQNVPPVVDTGQEKPLFVLDRLNIVNNLDPSLPMGIPAFANAIDQLKGVDVAYDSYVNEFVLGKKRVMIKPSATKDLDGGLVFDPNDIAFYVLPEDAGDGNVITPIDMALRTAEHNAGLQDMLNALSTRCGFGENHYKFENGSVATATQVVSENSTLFRTIKKHEIILRGVLEDLARMILRLGNAMLRLGLREDVEISIDFDDSIIEDDESDFSHDMQLLNAGIMNDWEFRAKWMNEDPDTAKASLPKMEDMTDEGQEEVE